MAISFDTTDRAILRLLKLNARRSNAEIAAEVGLSPSACHRRIRQLEAQVMQRESALAEAKLLHRYTTVLSPVEGYVTRKSVEAGQVVSPGQSLLAVAALDNVWVMANFKETDIERIRPGQEVELRVDTFKGRRFKGSVDSIMAGTGSAFALFPPENASGNYVKVVQRVPVKIVLSRDEDPGHVLRIGMSVVPTVLVR